MKSQKREKEKRYRVGGGVGLGEKCSLSEVAEIKSSLVLENVQIVVILVFENCEKPKKNAIN